MTECGETVVLLSDVRTTGGQPTPRGTIGIVVGHRGELALVDFNMDGPLAIAEVPPSQLRRHIARGMKR